MIATKHIRDLVYAGPGEVFGEPGDRRQHLLRCYRGVNGMGICDEGEDNEQEVASHGQ
jgi:hypothetical protein